MKVFPPGRWAFLLSAQHLICNCLQLVCILLAGKGKQGQADMLLIALALHRPRVKFAPGSSLGFKPQTRT